MKYNEISLNIYKDGGRNIWKRLTVFYMYWRGRTPIKKSTDFDTSAFFVMRGARYCSEGD